MKLQLYIGLDPTRYTSNILYLCMVEDKFCFYDHDTYDVEEFVKKNIKIFKRLKYTKERMIKDGCWMKSEANLIKELF